MQIGRKSGIHCPDIFYRLCRLFRIQIKNVVIRNYTSSHPAQYVNYTFNCLHGAFRNTIALSLPLLPTNTFLLQSGPNHLHSTPWSRLTLRFHFRFTDSFNSAPALFKTYKVFVLPLLPHFKCVVPSASTAAITTFSVV